MKKFINDPENLTSELLEGLALANKDIIHLEDGNLVVNNNLNILCSRMLWGLTNLVFEFILFLNNYHNSKESWQENAEKQYSFDFTGICCFRCYFDAHKLVFQQRWQ